MKIKWWRHSGKKSFVKPFIDSKGNKHLETQAYVEIGTVHSFLPGLLPLYLLSFSHTHFQFFLWLQEDNKQLNFQDLNTVLVPCRSHRISFSPPLYLIRERDSVITNINATQKPLGTCEVKKYKVPPKSMSMPALIMFFAEASGRKKDPPNKQTALISFLFCNCTLFL